MEPGWGAGFQAEKFESQVLEGVREGRSSRASGSAARLGLLPDEDDPFQSRTGRNDNRLCRQQTKSGRSYALDVFFPAVRDNGDAFVFQQTQVLLVEENRLESTGVIGLVALDPIGPHGWPAP